MNACLPSCKQPLPRQSQPDAVIATLTVIGLLVMTGLSAG
jgi:hypothetical protein